MIGAGRVVRVAALAVGGVLLVAGCSSGGGTTKTSAAASSTSAAEASDVPAGYDPCTDIPQSVLDQLQWTSKIPQKNSADDGTVWRGCGWAKPNYYAVAVYVTNATLARVLAQNYQDPQQFTVDGRKAISTRQVPDHPNQQCTVDVQIKGGSLEIFLSNGEGLGPGSSMNSCDMARDAVQQIVPTLPATL